LRRRGSGLRPVPLRGLWARRAGGFSVRRVGSVELRNAAHAAGRVPSIASSPALCGGRSFAARSAALGRNESRHSHGDGRIFAEEIACHQGRGKRGAGGNVGVFRPAIWWKPESACDATSRRGRGSRRTADCGVRARDAAACPKSAPPRSVATTRPPCRRSRRARSSPSPEAPSSRALPRLPRPEGDFERKDKRFAASCDGFDVHCAVRIAHCEGR
jgi:hypothetical protein